MGMDNGELVVDGGATHISRYNRILHNTISTSELYIVAGGGRTEELIMDIGVKVRDIGI